MVATGARHAEPPLRLTRRGRAVVLALLVLLASLASAVLFATASRAGRPAQSAAAPQSVPQAEGVREPRGVPMARSMVVQPGDTLWAVATRAMPYRDGQEAVAELRRINRLEGYGVDAGDVLMLPSGR